MGMCTRQTELPKVRRTVCRMRHVGTSSSAQWIPRGAVFTQDFLGECKGSLRPPGTHRYEALPTSREARVVFPRVWDIPP